MKRLAICVTVLVASAMPAVLAYTPDHWHNYTPHGFVQSGTNIGHATLVDCFTWGTAHQHTEHQGHYTRAYPGAPWQFDHYHDRSVNHFGPSCSS